MRFGKHNNIIMMIVSAAIGDHSMIFASLSIAEKLESYFI